MKINAINTNFKNYEIARLKNDTPIEKPVPETSSKDVFVKGNVAQDISFNGSLGGTVGAISGELLALGTTKCLSTPQGLFWPLAIFFGLTAAFGLFGSWLEDKIENKNKSKEQKV